MGTQGAKVARLTAVAQVVDVSDAPNRQTGAVRDIARLDDALKEGRFVTRRQHPPFREDSPRQFNGFPAGGFLKEGVIEDNLTHAAPMVARRNRRGEPVAGGLGVGAPTLQFEAVTRVLVISDLHYASAAEKARRGHEARAAGSRLKASALKVWRNHVWLRHPDAHNHRLAEIVQREPAPDIAVANGDFCLDTAFVGVSDDASFASASEALGRLRSAYGDRLHWTLGDHDLGKMSMFGRVGGPRLESWRRWVMELGSLPAWRVDVGVYSLVGVASTPWALDVFEPELAAGELEGWRRVGEETRAALERALEGVEANRRVLFFVHDPTALPFLAASPAIQRRLPQIERTILGHLHSPWVLRTARALAGMPRVSFMGQTAYRYTSALRRASIWKSFRVTLCPSPSGIQLLKDGGYLTMELDPEGRRPLAIHRWVLPWSETV